VLSLLAGTPPRIATLTAGQAPAALQTSPSHDGWSANEVLAHLRACADVWGACIGTMLAEERPALRAVSPRTWIRRTDYREWEFEPSLRAFAAQRAELLTVLERLPHDGWSRVATVTGAGKALERSLLSYAEQLARHEQPHITQVERLMGVVHT
jgi:hypothetical protein